MLLIFNAIIQAILWAAALGISGYNILATNGTQRLLWIIIGLILIENPKITFAYPLDEEEGV